MTSLTFDFALMKRAHDLGTAEAFELGAHVIVEPLTRLLGNISASTTTFHGMNCVYTVEAHQYVQRI